ncbi:hypothetical protein SAMN05421829_108145 [Aromatoleum tolulyticum]|uniref:Uncharacterized protein n=1 Tax=Aromatoleum tolulyticum TaxID=34027 RepID=A0A1N6X0L0_9RHOO|nr:hypothetical protein [Aromatoleum tolulyticum]SIQ95853.1 hypothetical protein SAMN05421829_108145 [Aromatoleum tolulyticum]
MTTRVSVTHHDAESGVSLLAQVFQVDPYGQVIDTPVRSNAIAPGVTATVHLKPGNVLVVREMGESQG